MRNGDKETLREEEISDVVINSLPGIFYLQSKNRNFLRWNKNFEKVSGYTADEIKGLTSIDFFDVKDHEPVIATIKKVFEEGEAEIEIDIITKHGKKIRYYLNGKAVIYEGEPCLIGMGIDISERVNTDKKIKKDQERLNYHINNSPLAVIEYDRDLKITFWSERAMEIFGWTEEEVMGKKVSEFLIYKYDIRKVTANLLRRHNNTYEKVPVINRNHTKDGRVLRCRWHHSFLTDESGNIETIMSIIRDITDLWKAAIQKQDIANDLMKRNRELEQFTYIVSHNLRSPVASLIGLTDILADYELTENEKKDTIAGISQSARRLDAVIKDLNDILRLKSDLNDKKELVNFPLLVKEIDQSIPEYFNKNKFIIKTDFSEVDAYYTLKNYITSIFGNLISNSIKYRRPDADPVIHITSKLTDQKLIIIFTDNGIGVDLNKTGADLFGMYKRFHFHVDGKGLGLFMVKTQVEMLGGKIYVSSEVNKGTEFRIEFDI